MLSWWALYFIETISSLASYTTAKRRNVFYIILIKLEQIFYIIDDQLEYVLGSPEGPSLQNQHLWKCYVSVNVSKIQFVCIFLYKVTTKLKLQTFYFTCKIMSQKKHFDVTGQIYVQIGDTKKLDKNHKPEIFKM